MEIKKNKLLFPAYCGTESFIFVSYSHKDSEKVFPEIERLHNMGFRVWYDNGIKPGSNWTEEIENAIKKATLFIVFMSENAVNSRNVRNEINFAFDENKPLLVMYLEEAVLRFGLKLMLSSIQAIKKYELPDEIYVDKIMKVVPDVLGHVPESKSFSTAGDRNISPEMKFETNEQTPPEPDRLESEIFADNKQADQITQLSPVVSEDYKVNEMAEKVIANIDSGFSTIIKFIEKEKSPGIILPGTAGQNTVERIKVGGQLWMKDYLNTEKYRNGDPIRQAKTAEEWAGKEGAWCYYDNDMENGFKFGKLYNWYAINDPRGLTPEGWHIPDILELESLVNSVTEDESLFEIMDEGNEIRIKSDLGIFSALMSGNRSYNGDFSGLGEYAYFWSSTDEGVSNAYRLRLKPLKSAGSVSLLLNNKGYGFSIRCVKDA